MAEETNQPGALGSKTGANDELLPKKTLGEIRVRTEFNVSKDAIVDKLKQKTAEIINLCEELKTIAPREASIAQTEYESAGHWAVKAATTPKV
jgi:hypothetical protein